MAKEEPLKDENFDYDIFKRRLDLDFQEKRPTYEVQHHENDMDSISSQDLLMTHYWNKNLTYKTDAKRRMMKLKKDQNCDDNKTVVAKKEEKPKLRLSYGLLFNEANSKEVIETWLEANKEEIADTLEHAFHCDPIYFTDESEFIYDE